MPSCCKNTSLFRVPALLDSFVGRYRALLALTAYATITAVAYGAAFLIRFEFQLPAEYGEIFLRTLPVLLALRLILSRVFRLTLGRWRFAGIGDIRRLVLAAMAGSVLFTVAVFNVSALAGVPRSVIALEWVLTLLLTAGVWITYRTLYEVQARARASEFLDGSERRVVLVGAGEAGNLLAREVARSPAGLKIVAVVDDDPLKKGTLLQGVKVLGTTAELPRIASETGADEIILAIPSAPPERIREIVGRCEAIALPLKVLPRLDEVVGGVVRVGQLRPLRIEDLLGRDPVRLDLPALAEELAGAVALVTGAAGSIGSELARQIGVNGPAHLVLLDHAETPLFYLERELRGRFPNLKLTAVVGDVLDGALVERVFKEHAPTRVYHAAAYKHVGMMEGSPRAALLNNALGTWRMAETAGRHGAKAFVLISTDKAVRPTSVMGGSKRLAELLVQGAQARYPETPYRTVRFGNVLGSNGSVVPIFEQQLREGRPLTVTHPEVTRYFMTIPEAVQLVLQASLLPEAAGRIAMLEMGQPVKIMDLARKMIQLSGADPERASITFVGLSAGEKLHEELVAPDETPEPTAHPKVKLVGAASAGGTVLDAAIEKLEAMASGATFSDGDADTWLWALLTQLGVAVGAEQGHGHGTRMLSAS